MNRRKFIQFAGAASFAASFPQLMARGQTANEADTAADGSFFSEEWLLDQARELSERRYAAPQLNLPDELTGLDRKRYDAIRFRPASGLWKDADTKFSLGLYHTGFQYKTPVDIHVVEGQTARQIAYSPSLFAFDAPLTPPPPGSASGFSGFNARYPIHGDGEETPFLSFQGASFFQAIASGQAFGTMARAVSINTAQAAGEEFPLFRALWIRKPAADQRELLVYGLLDGPSLTGAYKFRAEPGRSTSIDVECSLFPRREIKHIGIAPLNAMYFFGTADATRTGDHRPNVHSAQGLQIWNAAGEWIWRPLTNPEGLQYSVFADRTPRGFGLLQRKRDFSHYEDIEARFGERPSVWVEPMGEWGDGAVDLIEVPSRSEIYDNIIAFWRPKTALARNARRTYRYKLHWGWAPPVRSTQARVHQTRIGTSDTDGRHIFVIDFVSGHSCHDCNLSAFTADVYAGNGETRNVSVRTNPATGGHRVTFEFRPGGNRPTDLRCYLRQDGQIISETWIYRWSN